MVTERQTWGSLVLLYASGKKHSHNQVKDVATVIQLLGKGVSPSSLRNVDPRPPNPPVTAFNNL